MKGERNHYLQFMRPKDTYFTVRRKGREVRSALEEGRKRGEGGGGEKNLVYRIARTRDGTSEASFVLLPAISTEKKKGKEISRKGHELLLREKKGGGEKKKEKDVTAYHIRKISTRGSPQGEERKKESFSQLERQEKYCRLIGGEGQLLCLHEKKEGGELEHKKHTGHSGGGE